MERHKEIEPDASNGTVDREGKKMLSEEGVEPAHSCLYGILSPASGSDCEAIFGLI